MEREEEMITLTHYHKQVDRRFQREATAVMTLPIILIAIVAAVIFLFMTTTNVEYPAREKTPMEKGKHLDEEKDYGRGHKRTNPDLSRANPIRN